MPGRIDLEAITAESLFAAGHLKWTRYGPGRLGAFVAEMDYGAAVEVTDALHDAVDRALFGYLPSTVGDEMRAACAEWQRATYGWAVDPSDVHPLPDVIKGLEVAIEHFSPAGSPIVLPVPAYMPFFSVPGRLGRSTIEVDMVADGERYVLDLDQLDRAFADGGSMLILCNPHNPLGRVMEARELVAIADIVERHGGRVFSDEIHAPLVYPPHRHVAYASTSTVAAGHTVTAASASKAWNLAGLKCAQLIVSNDRDRERMVELGPFATHGASTLGVIANTVAYRHGRPWLDEVLAILDGNRRLLGELLAEHLSAVHYRSPEGTYLAWLDCRSLELPTALGEFFDTQAGVVMVDGARCGSTGAGFVRLNFATTPALLTEMVTRMATAVHAHG